MYYRYVPAAHHEYIQMFCIKNALLFSKSIKKF